MEKYLEALIAQYKLRKINNEEKLNLKGIGDYKEGMLEGLNIAINTSIHDLEFLLQQVKEGLL